MNKFYTLFLLLLSGLTLNAQVKVFHENFELSGNGADSVASSGAFYNWSLNSRLFHAGVRCDSNIVTANDTSLLTTNVFSTAGYSNVVLRFSHICKVELFDAGEVEISVNNGPWTKLTGTQYVNPGNSQFVNSGNKFNANTYPLDWSPAVNNLKPTQSWWKNEVFDLSLLAGNSTNVRIRFVLRDGNGNGANLNHGWFIDDIEVLAANSELIPPRITMITPIITDTIHDTGPFEIAAWIADNSGIDTAYIKYSVNNGSDQYVPMVWIADSTYQGTIPSYTYTNRISYRLYATDNASAHNTTESGNYWFYIKKETPCVEIGTESIQQIYPYSTSFSDARTQILFTAEEIQAASGTSGPINALAFNVASASAITMNGFTIQMQHTSLNTLTGFVNTGWTTVFSGTCMVSDIGWQSVSLQTPFIWDGINNVLINICYDNAAGSGNSPVLSSYAAGKTWTQNAATGAGCSLAAGTTQGYRPNIRFYMSTYILTEDAGVSNFLSPSGIILSGVSHPVEIQIKNYAQDTLKKATVAWELNGVPQPSFIWTGLLAEQVTSAAFTIGNISTGNGSQTIKAWTENPNDSIDEVAANDTLSTYFYSCTGFLSGTYTIGSGGDFPTFSSALNSMVNCGISGPVVFNVLPGTYQEQLLIPEIPGASGTNTIVFQSASGDYHDVVLQYAASSANDNYTVFLNGADHITFKNITLAARGTSYANVVRYTGNATYNTFFNNLLSGMITTSTSINLAVVYSPSGAGMCDSVITFDGNIVDNGSYGIYLYGQGSALGQLENRTSVINNLFNNQYMAGLYLYYHNAPEISGNIFISGATYPSGISIYTAYCDNRMTIIKNKITRFYGGYGINTYYCDGVNGKEALIANNMVSILGNNSSYGIYAAYGNYQKIFYNSVNIAAEASTSRPLYLTGTGIYHYIKNNIFAYTGHNSSGLAAYISNTAGVMAMNYNNLYSSGTQLGYWSGTQANLSAWQTASAKDSNSVSVNPYFVSSTDLHTYAQGVDGKATPLSEVTDDIDGHGRHATIPDIGACEFDVPADNIGILSFAAPVSSCGITSPVQVTIHLKNFGSTPITTADVYYSLNNGPAVHEVMTQTIPQDSVYAYTFTQPADMSVPGTYSFTAWVHLAGDTIALNDTISNYSVYSGYDFGLGAYTMGYELNEFAGDWSTIDVNGDNNGWTYYNSAGDAHGGTYSARLYNGNINTGNDWLFSRCFTLAAGSTYKIEFWYKVSNASYPQHIDLKAGNSPAPAAMLNNLLTLNSINNTGYQKATAYFVPAVTGSYYFGWWGHSVANAYYAFIDDINISLVPLQEAALLSIESPVSGCGLSAGETVEIRILNTGANDINGNLTAYYRFKNEPVVSQAVGSMITPGDTLTFAFTQPVDAHVSLADSIFPLKAWLSLQNDPFSFNDTISTVIASSHVPADPVTISDTIFFGGAALLQAQAGDSVYWFDTPSGGTFIASGNQFTTPNLFYNTVYYAQAITPGGTTRWTFDNNVEGWTVQDPCSSTDNWSWASDGGYGTLHAPDPLSFSSQFIISPQVMVAGTSAISLSFNHRYTTENCCDEGYVAYKLDDGPWILFVPSVNTYSATHSIDYDPLNSCSSSSSSCFAGTQASYITSSGTVNTSGASNIQLAFIFTSDVSVGNDGWYVDEVSISGGTGGCSSNRVPDTAFVILNSYDASVVTVSSPVGGCADASEPITMVIRNNGLNTINGNLTATYEINGSTPVSQAVTDIIQPGDSLSFTFSGPLITGLTQANQDSVFHIVTYINLANDLYASNDTVVKVLSLLYAPPPPSTSNVTIPYATQATLFAASADSIHWYDVASGGVPLSTSSTYNTPVLYNTTVYYADAYATGGTSYWSFDTNLEGWTSTAACGYTTTWVWASDAGTGAAYAQDVGSASSQVLLSPSIDLTGANAVTIKYRHRYSTESCCDHGYVLYKLNDNAWTSFVPTTGTYTSTYTINQEPLTGSCGSASLPCYSGTATYQTHKGQINTTGADSLQIAFVFSTDGSVSGDGWYIDSVIIAGSGSGCISERVADTVLVTGVPACDMSVLDIYYPVSGIELTQNEQVSVKVKNFGTQQASNIPISFSINGGPVITEMITGPIASNDTLIYTFTTTADLSGTGTYTISAFTALACDPTPTNDTAYKTVVNSQIPYCASSATYLYENIGNVTLGSLNNGNPYPVLNNITATSYYSDYTGLPAPSLTLGATYAISVAQIENYSTFYSTGVKVYIDYNRNGSFDLPAELAFSGITASEANPYVSGTITIPTTGMVSGMSTRMRIVMDRLGTAAPCGTYAYGETEDYFVFLSPQILHDAGVTDIIQPTSVETEADLVTVKAIVRNFGTDTIHNTSNMSVAFSHNSQAPQSAVWNGGDIPPLQSDTVTLPWLTVTPNLNHICAFTQLAGDSNTYNDSFCKTFTGTPLHDAGVLAFLSPGGESVSGSSSTVRVIIKNFGATAISSLNMTYKINGLIQATEPWTGLLQPGAEDTVTFAQTYLVPEANYNLCAYTGFVADSNNANDTLCIDSYGVFTSTLPYFDNFDDSIINWSAVNSAGSLWEIGQPSYSQTNSTFSPSNAWDINLSDPYGNNANSMLYTQYFDFSHAVDARMKFWFNINSEGAYDGFRIDYTVDTGNTWNVLGTVSDPNAVNWYNYATLVSSGKPAWTGTSSTWIYCFYRLSILNNVPIVRFRFVFNSDASTNGIGLSIDNFAIYKPVPRDVGIEAVSFPKVEAIAGSSMQLKVRIRNFGLGTLQNIPIAFKINDNGPIITHTWTGVLLPNDTMMATFTTPFTVPAGAFKVYAFTQLSGDTVNVNDTCVAHLMGVPRYFVPYADSLEGPCYWVSHGIPDLWEYGTPASTTINSAYSPTHAWKTNINGPYINNATSYLYSPWFNFSGVDSAYLEFRHWYHTQNGSDYGAIEYTVNNGTSWALLGTQGDPQAVNWYNALVGGAPSWSGNSSGYVYSRYRLTSVPAIINANGYVRFRFKFYSNASVCNYDGWAMDNFAITAPPIPKDAGISEIIHPASPVLTGSSVFPEVVVQNYGTDSLQKVPVRYYIAGGAVVSETWYGVLWPGQSAHHTFTTPYTSPGSVYTFCAFTRRSNDTYWSNDTLCASLSTSPAAIDVGIAKILEPQDYTLPGDTISVSVRIKNYGTSPQSGFSLVYLRNFVQTGTGTFSGTINPGDSADYTFATTFISPEGSYNLCARTLLANDADPANDELCKYPVGSGLEDYDYQNFYLLQNIPNPASDQTYILFYLPHNDRLIFELYDIFGRVKIHQKIDATSGENRIDLETASLPSGVYFYSIEFNSEKHTKRMVVIR